MYDLKYKIIIIPLSKEDGGGYLVQVPALLGCMTDGNTLEEAIYKIEEVIESWIHAARSLNREIPEPEFYSW